MRFETRIKNIYNRGESHKDRPNIGHVLRDFRVAELGDTFSQPGQIDHLLIIFLLMQQYSYNYAITYTQRKMKQLAFF